ncbi:tyrosyl-tRNA ligase [Fictibacillus macauensis ZFHKF-1]|uniref:Tyrosine--tRNA ligase n=1 Tax=Fictibacillus macauensis ZFHKF-1 TaxID=1196324 RepID=I8UFA5_9BACL|nr:tyrosine--tRNA ligase [Fictibacillus macauensis]EIT85478.1 tyrosyl-tRNA ligase [Fictibacillus macauensis ZFHKF-1]
MGILQELEFRGLINQVTDREGLEEKLAKEMTPFYCGFDPTADSLHVGHLLVVMTMRRLQQAGHQPIPLVGGGTGLIGDPSGKKAERTLNEMSVVQDWSDRIKEQLSKFLDFEAPKNPAKMANNYDWLGGINVIDFLRDVGKYFPLNYMLAKDSVSSRLEAGISFTEFTYMILQSYDFLQLYRQEGCRLQLGGSDQWGNITSGLELIRKAGEEERAFGLTIPLVTKSDGTKFGKTEGGAIWLDPEKTTPYEFYQFWINTDDRDVMKFLKYFSFKSQEELDALQAEVAAAPEKRAAQKALAEELTALVHGEAALQQAVKISQALFSGQLSDLTGAEIEQGFKDVPSVDMATKEDINIVDLLIASKVAPSKRQAREDVTNGAIYVNGERVQDLDAMVGESHRIDDRFIVLRRGKKKYFLLKY